MLFTSRHKRSRRADPPVLLPWSLPASRASVAPRVVSTVLHEGSATVRQQVSSTTSRTEPNTSVVLPIAGGRKVPTVNSRTRGSLDVALRISASGRELEAAIAKFEGDFFADGTLATQKARRSTLEQIARTVGVSLIPVTIESLTPVLAVLKAAGYRSAEQYISVALSLHVDNGGRVDERLACFLSRARDSLVRGLGPPQRAGEFSLTELIEKFNDIRPVPGGPQDAARAIAVAVWWLLREIEMASLKVKQARVTTERIAQLSLGVTKSDIQGMGAVRGHNCICSIEGGRYSSVCPVKLIETQLKLRESQGAGPDDVLFPDGHGQIPTKPAWVLTLQLGLTSISEEPLNGHTPRRVGAKTLARMSVPEWIIEWMGRWGSSAVRVYIEEAFAETNVGVFSDALATHGEKRQSHLALKDIHGVVRSLVKESAGSSATSLAEQVKTQAKELAVQKEAWKALEDKMVAGQLVAVCSEIVQETKAGGVRQVDTPWEFVLNARSGKVHSVLKTEFDKHHKEQEALCGWKLGAEVTKHGGCNYVRNVKRPSLAKHAGEACGPCIAHLMALTEQEGQDPFSGESLAQSSASKACDKREESFNGSDSSTTKILNREFEGIASRSRQLENKKADGRKMDGNKRHRSTDGSDKRSVCINTM